MWEIHGRCATLAAYNMGSSEIEERVIRAVDELLQAGIKPSFYAVAEAAQVARSTLYRKPGLKHIVEEGRSAAEGGGSTYLKRLRCLQAEVASLREENNRLKQKLSAFNLVKGSANSDHNQTSNWLHYEIITLPQAA